MESASSAIISLWLSLLGSNPPTQSPMVHSAGLKCSLLSELRCLQKVLTDAGFLHLSCSIASASSTQWKGTIDFQMNVRFIGAESAHCQCCFNAKSATDFSPVLSLHLGSPVHQGASRDDPGQELLGGVRPDFYWSAEFGVAVCVHEERGKNIKMQRSV